MSAHIVQRTPAQLRKLLILSADDLNTNRGQDGHNIEHLVYICSDGHFLGFLSDWISYWFKNRADLLAVPGGGLELCVDYSLMSAMLERARTLHRLHGTMQIWVLFHTGCGGYKHHRNTADPYEERAHQLQDMARIEEIMRAQGLLGLKTGAKLHFAIIRTSSVSTGRPSFVPLNELAAQARSLGLTIEALENDLRQGTEPLTMPSRPH